MNESGRNAATEKTIKKLKEQNTALQKAVANLQRQLVEHEKRVHFPGGLNAPETGNPVHASHTQLESERLSPQILEHLSDMLLVVELSACRRPRLLEINSSGVQALGIKREKLIGCFIEDLIPQATANVLCNAFRKCIESRATCNEVFTLELPGGGRDYRAALIPTCNANGCVDRITVAARDITLHERNEALQAAQLELEAKFQALAENSQQIICRYDRQLRLVYANSGLANVVGRNLQDLLGKNPNDHQRILYQDSIALVIDTGVDRDFELTTCDDKGEVRHHHIRMMPERESNGEIVGALTLGRDITDRKKAEQRLYASEQAFRAVVEHSPDFIARYDLNYRRVYANPALLNLMCLSSSDVIGKTPEELSNFVDAKRYMAQLQRVAETGLEVTEEVLLHDVSGRVRWGHMRIVPEFAPNGTVASMLAISRDIHELKTSEQLYRTLTENIPDLLARFDSEGRFIYVNPKFADAFDIPQAAFIGKTQRELSFLTESTGNEWLEQAVKSVFIDGHPNEACAYWQTKDGARIFEVRHIPETDPEGAVVSVLGIAHDITRLRSTELALRDSEHAFRTLAENAPDPIIRYDTKCRRTYVNPKFERVSGVAADNLTGMVARRQSGATAEVTRRFRRILRNIMASGVVAKFELAWEKEGKAQCWFVHAVPEKDINGVVQSALTVWRDITEQKEAEQRLRESYELLRELTSRRETAREEERKRIARELHDELGQQLTALRMGTSTLRIRFGQHNAELATQVQKILVLVDNTMLVLRDTVASLRPAVLDAGIVAALEWLAAEFSRDGQTACQLRMPEENTGIAEERAIALFRIAQEALTNIARHAMAKHVIMTLERRGFDCLLEVRDDGKGFNPAVMSNQSFGFIGMKERVVMLGGEIEIASAPGKGTAIRARVPIRHSDETL